LASHPPLLHEGRDDNVFLLDTVNDGLSVWSTARALVTVNSDTRLLGVEVMNTSEHPIRMPRGRKLGELHFLDTGPTMMVMTIVQTRERPSPSEEAADGAQGIGLAALRRFDTSGKVDERLTQQIMDKPVFDLSTSDLTSAQKEQLQTLLEANSDVFEQPTTVGNAQGIEHEVHPKEGQSFQPIHRAPYRYGEAENAFCDKTTSDMEKGGMIQPSSGPWAAPVVLAKKKDGGFRFCVDYRDLNAQTMQDVFPLPNIQEAIDALVRARYFSVMDARSGYWQVKVRAKDRAKTAFITRSGKWEWTVMPMGLINAPATFQRMMNMILAGLTWLNCLVYMDDIMVYSETFEEHLEHLQEVFNRLRSVNIRLHLGKSHFCQKETLYLGHIVSAEGVKVNPAKVNAVKLLQPPTSVRRVCTFLGMTGYYRRFIQNYGEIATPLVRLLQKDTPWEWTTECQQAFEALREKLIRAPILVYPNSAKRKKLYTDASAKALAAVLIQVDDDGKERVLSYWSRVTRGAEKNYTVTELECLACIEGVKQFRPYLYGQIFDIVTDHQALTALKTLKNPQGRLARWANYLQDYHYTVVYRPGALNGNADGLTRLPKERDPPGHWDDADKPERQMPASRRARKGSALDEQIRLNQTHAVNAITRRTPASISAEEMQNIEKTICVIEADFMMDMRRKVQRTLTKDAAANESEKGETTLTFPMKSTEHWGAQVNSISNVSTKSPVRQECTEHWDTSEDECSGENIKTSGAGEVGISACAHTAGVFATNNPSAKPDITRDQGRAQKRGLANKVKYKWIPKQQMGNLFDEIAKQQELIARQQEPFKKEHLPPMTERKVHNDLTSEVRQVKIHSTPEGKVVGHRTPWQLDNVLVIEESQGEPSYKEIKDLGDGEDVVKRATIAKWQSECPTIGPYVRWMEDGTLSEDNRERAAVLAVKDDLR